MGARVSGDWFEQLQCAVTVCGADYRILYMNEKSGEVNRESGGRSLVGKSLLDCHPAAAKRKLKRVMVSAKPNVYVVERKGKRKIVFQGQWMRRGKVAGLVEFYFELPKSLKLMVRS